MQLYNERMCVMCWDMERLPKKAAWVCKFSTKNLGIYAENYCDTCASAIPDWISTAQEDGEDDFKFLGKDVFEENPIPVFVRGDRVNIVRPTRPPQSGTVVHCYLSNRTFTVMANVVVDGKKWPTVFPAHILEKRVPPEMKERAA